MSVVASINFQKAELSSEATNSLEEETHGKPTLVEEATQYQWMARYKVASILLAKYL